MIDKIEARKKQEDYELVKRALLFYAKSNESIASEIIDNTLRRLLEIFHKSEHYEIEVEKMDDKFDKRKLKSEFAKKYGYKESQLTDEFLNEIISEQIKQIEEEERLFSHAYGFEINEESEKYTEGLIGLVDKKESKIRSFFPILER
ncbi:MAG: hypothetical protein JJU26_12980 [Oceanicaulis sp.]|nr:hypothetical protein [Oceanicaulis sp.]